MNETKQKNGSILIVDDTPENIQVLGGLLESKNYKVYAAQNGAQALKVADQKLHDIILLDVMMPELNGFETCQKLKESEKTKDIPVIFLTAKTELDDIMKGFECGGVDYVTKPFNSAELLKRIETHIELRNSTEALKEINSNFKELIHVLCHDLGNPIYAVQGILELGLEDKKFLEENIEIMNTAVKNAVEIIDVIKKLRALEENKIQLKLETYDLILDAVGKSKNSNFKKLCRKALNTNGKYISVDDGSPKETLEDLIFLKELVEAEKLKPVIDKIFAVEEMVEAHTYVDKGHKRGNVIVVVNNDS